MSMSTLNVNPAELSDATPPSKPLLLIVDDQPSNLQTLYTLFEDTCDVCMATSGEDALVFCQNQRPDLILLDVVMPGLGGYQVCKQLKEDPLTQYIPIIFVTAQNNPEEEAHGFSLGGVDFISKPFHANVVKARVRTHLTLKHQSDLLRTLSLTDGLTGVANRRQFDEVFQLEWRRCARSHEQLALILIDIDFFKLYNDHYGHQAGDTCLQQVATTLKAQLSRSHDLVARYGGEEFICILPNTPFEGAYYKANQLEQAIRDLAIAHAQSQTTHIVTISLGLAIGHPYEGGDSAQLIKEADNQLYHAKNTGRGKVCAIDWHKSEKQGTMVESSASEMNRLLT